MEPKMSISSDSTHCASNSVLIVDDDDSVRDVFERLLNYSLPQCKTHVASNGQEAIRLFRRFHHSVILMDLRMPVMDGATAAQRIEDYCRSRGWDRPVVVFCTGHTPGPALADRLVARPAALCLLHKPITSELLLRSVKSGLAAA